MEKLKKAASILLSVLLWAIVLVAALFAFTTLATKDSGQVSNIAGFTPLTVQSDSMAPTFKQGDLIFIKTCDPATLEEGDIITFHTIIENVYALNTHRIVEITEENGVRSYVTKGDNNAVEDTHIIVDGDIVGKYVSKLGGFGKVMDFLSSSIGFLIVIVLPMLVFFVYQVYHLITVSQKLKRAMAEEEAAEKVNSLSADETAAKLAEAEAALAEAQRLRDEAERKLAEAENKKTEVPIEEEPAVEQPEDDYQEQPAEEIPSEETTEE